MYKEEVTAHNSVYFVRRDLGMERDMAYQATIHFINSKFFTEMAAVLSSDEEVENEYYSLTHEEKLKVINELFEEYRFVKFSSAETFERTYQERNKAIHL